MKTKCKILHQLHRIFMGVLLFGPLVTIGQTYKMYPTDNYHNHLRLNTKTGEVQQIQDDGKSWPICSAREMSGDKTGRFRLYKTQNMWTFILLDTYTGKNWQVQFSLKGQEYRFAAAINSYSFAYPDTLSNWVDRFQLNSTENTWTFILLDSYNGRLWQVQYNVQDLDNIFCIPINKYALVSNNEESIFSIQPLTSIFQYYLINDNTGDMWKFQWSTKGDEYRWIEKF